MKNKDKYDLRSLSFSVSYQVTGCGKKIDPPRFITIKSNNEVIASNLKTDKSVIEFILEWLEIG